MSDAKRRNPAQSALVLGATRVLRATRMLAERSEQSLKQAVAEAIGDRYVESNRTTAELLGVDLAAYGWML
jgi:hypothetical protein